MQITDLRDWLKEADKRQQLLHIEGADWDEEIGCITSLNLRTKNPHALLFDNIKGYPSGYRVVTGATSNRGLVSLTLDLPEFGSNLELSSALRAKIPEWDAMEREFPPEVVKTGPVLDNVFSGEDVDLFKFPVPKWSPLDGGRYIGTGHVVITRDPDDGWVNLGTYRVMVHDRNTTGLHIVPGRHGAMHLRKYHERGKSCPVAVSVGHDPLIHKVGSTPLPLRTPYHEYQYAGAVKGRPIRVIMEELTDLPIPADAEIVFVGWCPPDKKRMEGPFGEWTGYYGSLEKPEPIIEVERVYYRNDPIITGSPPGIPPHDDTTFGAVVRSAMLHNEFANAGITDIRGVWLDEQGVVQLVIISLKQSYAGHAKRAALMAAQSRYLGSGGRYVIVVDEDIDPTNPEEVRWAVCTRSTPEKDIDIIRRTYSSALDPTIRKPTSAPFGSIAIIDACKPYEWIDEFPKPVKYSPELIEKVKQRWSSILG